ncbi:MAG: FGGY-family carbohydrate kinase [Chthoniobacterales bacterium]|nr:FGGY-family carbohydrate kinase [Chthoniobacterales bacterium]
MAAELCLGLDISTQSLTGLVIDAQEAEIVALESVNYGRELPEYGAPNGFIRDFEEGVVGTVGARPEMWLDALEVCLARLGRKVNLRNVRAISGSGQQHGSVYLSKSYGRQLRWLDPGKSLRIQLKSCFTREVSPIWMDTSTSEECREIGEVMGGAGEVCRRSGSVPIERFTGPQIRRFFKRWRAAYERTEHIGLVSSFMAGVLAGRIAPVDRGDGAGMNLMDIGRWEWDLQLLEATAPELLRRLPRIDKRNGVIGRIAEYFVQRFGFRPDTRVVTFTGDNPASLVGMGATEPGKVVISLGTSDTFFAAMERPHTDPDGFGHVFGNPGGEWMTLQCFVNGSLARERVRDRCGWGWMEFNDAILKETKPGNGGNVMLPFFQPEISPKLNLSEPVLDGSAEFMGWKDKAGLVRACVEGQFVNMRMRVKWMNLSAREILLTGGASRSDGIAQVVADVFQAKVRRLSVSDSAALGAAMLAASGGLGKPLAELQAKLSKPEGGAVEPNAAAAGVYEEIEAKLQGLLERVCGKSGQLLSGPLS